MDEINLERLAEYARRVLNCSGDIVSVDMEQMTGGRSPAELTRIRLQVESCPKILDVVKKETWPTEVKVILKLNKLKNASSLPELIDHTWNPASDDMAENWFITPFYDGMPLTFNDEVPADVVYTLARVHHHYQHQIEEFEDLFCVESAFFERTLTQARTALEEAVKETEKLIFEQGLQKLKIVQNDGLLFETLEHLPVTLTHGDMHPTNMVRLSDGRTVLLDWGGARIAPSMLDLANLVPIESKSWSLYLDAWEEISGSPLDLRTAQLGYYWATAMVNSMYLPHAIKYFPPEHVGKMADKVFKAKKKIETLS